MEPATANCSRRSLGIEIVWAGALLGCVMFPEDWLMLCDLFVCWCNATLRVSKAGYIMLPI